MVPTTLGQYYSDHDVHYVDTVWCSGRLPYTVAKSEKDYSARVDYSLHLDILHIPYSEGLFIDYRHFDQVSECYERYKHTLLLLTTYHRPILNRALSLVSVFHTQLSRIRGCQLQVRRQEEILDQAMVHR